MVNGMVWWASHGICIGLVGFGMVWFFGHDILYCMAWRGKARYMVWPCGHGMVYMVWFGLAMFGMV